MKFSDVGGSLIGGWETASTLLFPPCCCLCLEPTIGDPPRFPVDPEKSEQSESGERRAGGRIYPTFCKTCDISITQSRVWMTTACDRCGWPTGRFGDDSFACPRCERLAVPHRFSRITPLYRYQDAVTAVVVAAKYPSNSAITWELAHRLATRCRGRWGDLSSNENPLDENLPHPPIVTSVPSPWWRQARRGGSGTRLLAKYFARSMGWRYHGLLRTTRSIAKQAWLDDEARRENVRGAFALKSRFSSMRSAVAGREIILVDDVMTTGATADEVAGVLCDAGARRVSLAVVAIAIRES